MANEIVRTLNYLCMGNETDWGQLPDPATYFHIPVLNYTVVAIPQERTADPFVGFMGQAQRNTPMYHVAGRLTAPLYGWKPTNLSTSIMQFLIDWGFGNQQTLATPSKFAEWAEGPNVANKRHLGLRVDQATIMGSADLKTFVIDLALQGQSEVGSFSAQTLPTNRNKLVEPQFPAGVFTLNGSTIKLKSIQLTVARKLQVEWLNSTTPYLILATNYLMGFKAVPAKNADTYDAYRRNIGSTEYTGVLEITANHNGTGSVDTTNTVATITMNRLGWRGTGEVGQKNQIAFQEIDHIGLKPDTSDQDLTIVYTES